MHKFRSKVGSVQKIPKSRNWIVVNPFFWWIDYETKNERVIVPKGFITNFASVPRWLWIFVDPTGYNSYVLHDYLYKILFRNNREFCDRTLYIALIVEGCNEYEAMIVYKTVQKFGGEAWEKCRNDLINCKNKLS